MRKSSKRRHSFERRIKDLSKESGLLREDIRALSRFVKNPEIQDSFPRLKSDRYTAPVVRPRTRVDPVDENVLPEPGASVDGVTAVGQNVHLGPAGKNRVQAPPRIDPSSRVESDAQVKRTVPRDERFASLFSSGGFLGGPVPVRQEKSVQRNKAIFMIVIVVIVLFIVLQLISQ